MRPVRCFVTLASIGSANMVGVRPSVSDVCDCLSPCPLCHILTTHNNLNRYRRTSSVGAMLEELNWEPLASRRHTARLVLFGATRTEVQHNSGSTQTENSLAYHITASSVDYQKNSFFSHTVRDWNCLLDNTVHTLLPEQFRGYVSL